MGVCLEPWPTPAGLQGLVPTESIPCGMLQRAFMGLFPTQHQGLSVSNVEKVSDPHSPSSSKEDSSDLVKE